MKKALLLLMALICCMSIDAQKVKTVSANIGHFFCDAETRVISGTGIKVHADSLSCIGRGLWSGNDGNSFTISMNDGSTITCIKLTGKVLNADAPDWKEEEPGYVWTGSAKSVKTGSLFEKIEKIEVTYIPKK